ncbi:MAG: aminopeptidase P family protein [Phycisphaerae bacterium]|nr:aminopeptidase P family protein [Phycisphaerae bacterium]
MKIDILKKRVKKVRKILVQKGLDALILTAEADVSYLSGFRGDDSWLVLGKRDVWLVTDSRYTLAAKKECSGCKIYERKGAMTEAVADVLKKINNVKTVAVEDKIETALFEILKKKIPGRLAALKSPAAFVRQIKDEIEAKAIRKAAAVAQKALGRVLSEIRAGVSETEVAAMLDFELKKTGAQPAFEAIVAFGSNSAMPHHRPTTRKLKKIDTILIDFGAKLNGYCCDITRCFAIGRVNDFYRKVYKAVFCAQSRAMQIVKSGASAKKVDAAAKEIIESSKLPVFGHGTGHGLGLEVHERPVVSVLSKDVLQQGNVVTIEPAVYLPNKFGVRIEDNVLVTDSGCKVLTTRLKNDEVPLLKIKNKR